jgi:uncharacterized protein (TIGR02444 family)
MADKMEFPTHPFWDYALPLHESKGVGEAVIAMQDRHGVNVNVVLLSCWVGASGRGRLGEEGVRKAIEAAEVWNRDVVQQLRQVRRVMRPGIPPIDKSVSDALRRRILEVEIDCERAEIVMLGQAFDRAAQEGVSSRERAEDVAANLRDYFRVLGIKPDTDDFGYVHALIGAAVPDIAQHEGEALAKSMIQ